MTKSTRRKTLFGRSSVGIESCSIEQNNSEEDKVQLLALIIAQEQRQNKHGRVPQCKWKNRKGRKLVLH